MALALFPSYTSTPGGFVAKTRSTSTSPISPAGYTNLSVTSQKFTETNHSPKIIFKIFFVVELKSFQNLFSSELLILRNLFPMIRRSDTRIQSLSLCSSFPRSTCELLLTEAAVRVRRPPPRIPPIALSLFLFLSLSIFLFPFPFFFFSFSLFFFSLLPFLPSPPSSHERHEQSSSAPAVAPTSGPLCQPSLCNRAPLPALTRARPSSSSRARTEPSSRAAPRGTSPLAAAPPLAPPPPAPLPVYK